MSEWRICPAGLRDMIAISNVDWTLGAFEDSDEHRHDLEVICDRLNELQAENQRLREAAGKLRRDVAAEYVDAMPVTIHNALVDFDRATRTSDEGGY